MIEESYAEYKEFLKGDFKEMTKHHLKFGDYDKSGSVAFTVVRKFGKNNTKAIDTALKKLALKYANFNKGMKHISLSPDSKTQGILMNSLIESTSKLGSTIYSEEIYSAFRKVLVSSSKRFDVTIGRGESFDNMTKRVDKVLTRKGWNTPDNVLDFTYDDLVQICWEVCDPSISKKVIDKETKDAKNN